VSDKETLGLVERFRATIEAGAVPAFTLDDYARICHAANVKWWIDIDTGERLDRNKFELLCLVHSEISEAMEGERKGLKDDKLPHRPMAEVELVDALIRLFDYAGAFGYELMRQYFPEHHNERRDGTCPRCSGPWGFPGSLNVYAREAAEKHPPADNKGEALSHIHDAVTSLAFQERAQRRDTDDLGVWRVEDALAWVFRSIFAYAGKHGYDLQGAFDEKMRYNAQRADHTHESRKAAGGKKF
jgi:hypothetical protein